jgi:hypothetical protein
MPSQVKNMSENLAKKPYKVVGSSVEVKLEIYCVNMLVGQILTILDTVPDKTQREALKSLAKQSIWDWAGAWQTAILPDQLKDVERTAQKVDGGIEDPRIL